MNRDITLENKELFLEPYQIPEEKIDRAIEEALNKIERNMPKWKDGFAKTHSTDFLYEKGINDNWVCGMETGIYWLAYELSGKENFLEMAHQKTMSFQERFEKKIGMDDHDVGFAFSPSCVAGYKVTGDARYKKIALEAGAYYYNTSYTKKGGFVMRSWKWPIKGCRTMMDTMMNVPFLYWCGEQTGNMAYTEAARSQNQITEKYLIREDGSSFHHYQFEEETLKPLYGLTLQGYSDDSCWSRGLAWAIYGYPIAYAYTKEEYMLNVQKAVTYYMLNHLPKDWIPKWDLIFTEEDVPKDSSAGAITVCGMLEMCKYLPEESEQKKIYQNASARMLEAVIDNCSGDIGRDYDGLIYHVTHAVPQGFGIDECAIYGDYFYLEALMRYKKPDWNRYW